MQRSLEHRDIKFQGTPGGALERVVKRPNGREYIHRCSQEAFEAVAGYLEEHPGERVRMLSVAEAVNVPPTQVNVAMNFLEERGLLEIHDRLCCAATGYAKGFYEHALTEFFALIDGHPPEFQKG